MGGLGRVTQHTVRDLQGGWTGESRQGGHVAEYCRLGTKFLDAARRKQLIGMLPLREHETRLERVDADVDVDRASRE